MEIIFQKILCLLQLKYPYNYLLGFSKYFQALDYYTCVTILYKRVYLYMLAYILAHPHRIILSKWAASSIKTLNK